MRFARVVFRSFSSQARKARLVIPAVGLGAIGVVSFSMAENKTTEKAELKAGKRIEGLPQYRLADLKRPDGRIWVAYKEGVYDITEFIEGHPGGKEKIMMAAGGRVDGFWRMYQQHESQEFVLEILEQYRVGNLDPADKMPESAAADPYALEPARSPELVVQSARPFNGETPSSRLAESFLTPNDVFYTRNHMAVPWIDVDQYKLVVETPDGRRHEMTLDELKNKYAQRTVVATIQCAGNRRNEMMEVKAVRGGKWDAGAISNAEWKGVYLRDVLRDLGYTEPSDQVKHVHFEGLDRDTEKNYGASIPAEVAFSPEKDVLLAFEMNGEPIPRDHGFPVRAIVPGVVGARNVKWLGTVRLAKDESLSHWQQRDYRGFPPNIDWDNVDWQSMPSIQELPVISAITTANAKNGEIFLEGYAWSGGGRRVIRVDLTTDDGKTWTQASIKPRPASPHGRDYAWSLWEARVAVPPNAEKVTVASRATDDSYNTQPERVDVLWNMRGVLNNSWSRKQVDVKN